MLFDDGKILFQEFEPIRNGFFVDGYLSYRSKNAIVHDGHKVSANMNADILRPLFNDGAFVQFFWVQRRVVFVAKIFADGIALKQMKAFIVERWDLAYRINFKKPFLLLLKFL